MELLKATGNNTLEDVGKLCDIDVTNKSFWLESLSIIEKDIEAYTQIEL
jgi:oligoendopeptidase F